MVASLTPDRLAELRRIAEVATPGPYEVVGLAGIGGPYALRMTHRSGRTWYGVEGIKRREDAEYFVAMNRNTVLALLDEIERLRQQYEALRAGVERVADDLADACPHCGAAHIDDPGQLLSGYIAAEWVCGTWQDGDGDVHRSGECRERQEADET